MLRVAALVVACIAWQSHAAASLPGKMDHLLEQADRVEALVREQLEVEAERSTMRDNIEAHNKSLYATPKRKRASKQAKSAAVKQIKTGGYEYNRLVISKLHLCAPLFESPMDAVKRPVDNRKKMGPPEAATDTWDGFSPRDPKMGPDEKETTPTYKYNRTDFGPDDSVEKLATEQADNHAKDDLAYPTQRNSTTSADTDAENGTVASEYNPPKPTSEQLRKDDELEKVAGGMLVPKNASGSSSKDHGTGEKEIADVEQAKSSKDTQDMPPVDSEDLLELGESTPEKWAPSTPLEKWLKLVYDKSYKLEELEMLVELADSRQAEIEELLDDMHEAQAAAEADKKSRNVPFLYTEKQIPAISEAQKVRAELVRGNLQDAVDMGAHFDCTVREEKPSRISDDGLPQVDRTNDMFPNGATKQTLSPTAETVDQYSGLADNCTMPTCEAMSRGAEARGKELPGMFDIVADKYADELQDCCSAGAAKNLHDGRTADGEALTASNIDIRDMDGATAADFKCPSLVLAAACAKQIHKKFSYRRMLLQKSLRAQETNHLAGFNCSVYRADSNLGFLCTKVTPVREDTAICKGIHAKLKRATCRRPPHLPKFVSKIAEKNFPNYRSWNEVHSYVDADSGLLDRPVVSEVSCERIAGAYDKSSDEMTQPTKTARVAMEEHLKKKKIYLIDKKNKPGRLGELNDEEPSRKQEGPPRAFSCGVKKISVCRSDGGCSPTSASEHMIMHF